MLELFTRLTNEQKKELNTLTTAAEVLDFARGFGVVLTWEEAAEIAARLPDDELDAVSGGVPRPGRDGLPMK